MYRSDYEGLVSLRFLTIRAWVPELVFELADNPNNVRIMVLSDSDKNVSIVVYETNFSEQLTSPSEWNLWLSGEGRYGIGEDYYPDSYHAINHLHVTLSDLIEAGKLKITDRVLLYFDIFRNPDEPEVFYINEFDCEKEKNIATTFYTQTLPAIAKKVGVRFIVGQNNPLNFEFFIKKIGRSAIDQIKPEFRKKFFPTYNPISEYPYMTIQFLYPEDRKKYLVDGETST